eukprot:scaffold20743_cov62-Phaeocystis_antarctica.AAC.2
MAYHCRTTYYAAAALFLLQLQPYMVQRLWPYVIEAVAAEVNRSTLALPRPGRRAITAASPPTLQPSRYRRSTHGGSPARPRRPSDLPWPTSWRRPPPASCCPSSHLPPSRHPRSRPARRPPWRSSPPWLPPSGLALRPSCSWAHA